MSDGRNRPQTACRSGRLQDEGAWDFRTTDRLRKTNTPKFTPLHSVPHRRKTIKYKGIEPIKIILCLAP